LTTGTMYGPTVTGVRSMANTPSSSYTRSCYACLFTLVASQTTSNSSGWPLTLLMPSTPTSMTQ
jgi:hypothetical protein